MTDIISTEKARRALLHLGDFEMTDDGLLAMLDVGYDGKRHMPRCCKAINDTIFEYSGFSPDIRNAEIEFSGDAEIRIEDNAVFKLKYSKNNSQGVLDLRKASSRDIRISFMLLSKIRDLELEYIFEDSKFYLQIAEIISIVEFWGGVGLDFSEENGKITVLLGNTDITDKLRDFDNLEEVVWEVYSNVDISADISKELCDALEEFGFCDKGAFRWYDETVEKARGGLVK